MHLNKFLVLNGLVLLESNHWLTASCNRGMRGTVKVGKGGDTTFGSEFPNMAQSGIANL